MAPTSHQHHHKTSSLNPPECAARWAWSLVFSSMATAMAPTSHQHHHKTSSQWAWSMVFNSMAMVTAPTLHQHQHKTLTLTPIASTLVKSRVTFSTAKPQSWNRHHINTTTRHQALPQDIKPYPNRVHSTMGLVDSVL